MSTTHFSGPIALGSDRFKAVSGAKTVTEAENGTTFLLSGTGAAITLPGVKSGLEYKFVVSGAFATDFVITAATAVLNGTIMEAGVVQLVAADTTLTLEDGVEVIGDWITILSDGTSWFVDGSFSAGSSITPA